MESKGKSRMESKTKKVDFPCSLCKHTDLDHYNFPGSSRWCEKCFYEYGNDTSWQHVYKPDNLRYLEQKYDNIP